MKVRNNIFGNVSITWDEPMSVDEYDEIETFVALWLRGLKRRIEAADGELPRAEEVRGILAAVE